MTWAWNGKRGNRCIRVFWECVVAGRLGLLVLFDQSVKINV